MGRILVTGFCSIPAPSRPGVQLGHIIEGLSRRYEVDVLSVRRGEQEHVERHASGRHLRVPLPDTDLMSQIEVFRRALRRQIEGAEYDVVHFRDGWTGVTALEMQGSHGFATVFDLARSPMAEPVLTDLAMATELERAEQTCVRRGDLVLAPTDLARQYLAGLTDVSKIHVVPPGVNVDHFDWEEGASSGAPIILYLGALTPGRGVRVLLRSMLDVAAASDAMLMLAGPATDAFTKSLQTAIRDLKLEGRVQLLGEVPHSVVPTVLSRATICVAPGAAELEHKPTALFPTKILEYMASRRAVVAPARGTVTKLLCNNEHALFFEAGAPEDLADKLLLLLRDDELRNQIAQGGYELVRANHTASGTRRCLRRAYDWLAQQKRLVARLGGQESESLRAEVAGIGVRLGTKSDPTGKFVGTTPAADREGGGDAEITRVEIVAAPSAPREHSTREHSGDSVAPLLVERESTEEGTEVWDVPLEVIEDDTASRDVGVPPEREVAGSIVVSGVVHSTKSSAESKRILPATGPGSKTRSATLRSSAENAKTRVLAVASVDRTVIGKRRRTSDAERSSRALTQVVRGASPRPPKLPNAKPAKRRDPESPAPDDLG